MSDESPHPSVRKRPWRLFGGLLILVALLSCIIAWAVRPSRIAATALFQVNSVNPSVIGDGSKNLNNGFQDREVFRETHIALIKSYFVLEGAVRDPSVNESSLFWGSADPVEWLQTHLEVGFPEDSEILEIKLRGTRNQASELVQIVDAIATAYSKEAIDHAKQQRLDQRDLLVRSLDRLSSEIKHKYEEYLDIAKARGLENGSDAQRQLDMKRLDRIDEELSQLEREQLKIETGGDNKDANFIAKRIDQLRKRQEELEKSINVRNEKSVDLITRKNELDLLQRVADDMTIKLEKLDIDLVGPQRVRPLQPAMIELEQVAARPFPHE